MFNFDSTLAVRVRTIPEKLPSTQYSILLGQTDTNTNTDTRQIISLLPRAAALSGLDT